MPETIVDLKRFCCDDLHMFDGELNSPCLVFCNGWYAVATDTKLLVAIPNSSGAYDGLHTADKSKAKLTELLKSDRTPIGSTSAEAIREWCGDYIGSKVESCDCCDGTGECRRCTCDAKHECGRCEGTGKLDTIPESRPGRIKLSDVSIPLDRNLLAKAFSPEVGLSGDCDVLIGTGLSNKNGPGSKLFEFQSNSWRVLISSLASDPANMTGPVLALEPAAIFPDRGGN